MSSNLYAYFLQTCFALGIVLALLYLLLHKVLPKFMHQTKKLSSIRIKERMTIGHKKELCVVEIENKRLLLGVTDNTISLVCKLSDSHEK